FSLFTQAQIAAPSDEELMANKDEAINLINTRRKLDQLIWGPEVLAQEYEKRITQLWDDLLRSKQKLKVLAAFPFSSLQLAAHQNSDALQLNIARYTFSGEGPVWSQAQWQKFIADAEADGYVLEQSEWHHSRFQAPGKGLGARSEVNFELHVGRAQPAHMVIIKGVLDIQWKVQTGTEIDITADTIDVMNLTILEREKPPAFQEVFTVAGTNNRPLIHPVLVYDLNGDGLSEIVLGGQNIVLRNHGGGNLVAEQLFDVARPLYDGAVIADFTGDGAVDFIGVDNRNFPLLYKGDADGNFKGEPVKISDIHLGLPKTFTAGDIDGDGDLDVHIANYKYAYRQGQMPSPYYDANDGYPAVMLRNDGDGKFSDVTESSGLAAKRNRRSYSSSLVDLDDDQDMDLIVVSDYAGFDVYLNDGKGKFTDISDDFGLDRHFFGMGHTFDDFDGDGKLDFYVIGMSSTTARRLEDMGVGRADLEKHTEMRKAMGYGNRMFLRRDDGFVKAPFNDQVARTGWSWGTSTFDFDNDGDKDIFVANGHYSGESTQDYCTTFWRHDIYEEGGASVARDMLFQAESTDLREANISWNGYEHKVLFLKHGDEYINVAYLMGVAFEYDARAVVTEDIDNDGRPDLLVVEHQAQGLSSATYRLHVYRNALAEAGHWIGVQLADAKDTSPIGATVEVTTPSGKQFSRVVTGDSFSAQHSAKLHFGLGASDEVESIKVTWADGRVGSLKKPKADSYHRIDGSGH
ncbi:MAG: CRTAC1 family protein, partial [Arenicella sp.]|nr:CRTAC1 family protein [Arenicella sp.]